jgi:hypothetical protein
MLELKQVYILDICIRWKDMIKCIYINYIWLILNWYEYKINLDYNIKMHWIEYDKILNIYLFLKVGIY